MAGLIPENLRNDKRVPALLRRVGAALSVGLDDDATVWFRPHLTGVADAPDFVVLDPSLGVVVLGVVDEGVLGVFGGRLRIADGAGERELDDPARRAQDAAAALTAMVSDRPALTAVPVGAAVAFPDIDRSRAEAVGLDTMLDLDRALFKDDLDRILKNPEGALLRRRLLTILEGGLGEALEPAAHTELRAVLRPDLVIAPSVKQGSLFGADPDTVKVMDRAQERLATSLGSGHRVVHGVAGSGKTLVLVHRARLLARLLSPPHRILVTCYTKVTISRVLR